MNTKTDGQYCTYDATNKEIDCKLLINYKTMYQRLSKLYTSLWYWIVSGAACLLVTLWYITHIINITH